MIARKVCLFPQDNFSPAPMGARSCAPTITGGSETNSICVGTQVVKGAQRG
jgi:hypothetical protein